MEHALHPWGVFRLPGHESRSPSGHQRTKRHPLDGESQEEPPMPRSPHAVPVALLLVSASALALAAPVPTPRDKRPPHQIEAAQELLAQLKKLAADPKQDVDRLSKLWQQMRLEH